MRRGHSRWFFPLSIQRKEYLELDIAIDIAARYRSIQHNERRHLEGLKTMASSFSPKETMERLESEISAKGMKVFARVDHAAGAADAGLFLRPTDLIIFGNARAGTPLLQASQTVGIDLPLKALVWQDEAGKTWLSYYEPNWIIGAPRLGDRGRGHR
jgi:uncharacterized protein (DUF302 family)